MISNRKITVVETLSVLLILIYFLFAACSSSKPIKVGLIAGLTGRVADMGIAGRDGALLAVEEVNSRGGINGRKISLIIRDDKQEKDHCQRAVSELIAEDVVAIVGPMTSSMGLVVAPVVNKHKIPTISPTASTPYLAGLDDYFFRIIPVSSNAARVAAGYLYHKMQVRNVLVVYDQGNSGYTEPWLAVFRHHFESFGESKVEDLAFTSKHGSDFKKLAENISKRKVESLLILANPLDTALISQQLSKFGVNHPKIASEWSLRRDLIEYGGRTVEGMRIFHSFDQNSTSPDYQKFAFKFNQRFGYSTDFASAYGYNAMSILLESLAKGLSSEQIKENILAGSPYKGVQRQIRLNRYGDAERHYSLLRIVNGKFRTIESNVQN